MPLTFFFFYKNRQVDPKIYIEMQGTQNNQINLEKEVGRLTLPELKT